MKLQCGIMLEQTRIDHLETAFRLPKGVTVNSVTSHMIGKFYTLSSESNNYILQLYESIHTQRQISSDLTILRSLVNQGFEVPIPLISKNGDSIDLYNFEKPSVLFSKTKQSTEEPLTEEDIYRGAQEISQMDSIFSEKKSCSEFGKKIDVIFTMFELAMREENRVDDLFKSEYFAFKASYIELLNQIKKPSFSFFPGNHTYFLNGQNHLGFTARSFLYEMPELFALSQFILATCFDDNQLNFRKLDQATNGFASMNTTSDKTWNTFDAVLKNAAFLDVLCCWLSLIYHPQLIQTDLLIEARIKQKHLVKFVLKEAL